MAQKEDVMRVMYERCCGLNIHKSSIAACALITEKGKTPEETRRFGTMTGDLRELAGWLQQKGIRHVAMESTGVYWKPVWKWLNYPRGRYETRSRNCAALWRDKSRRIIDRCSPDTGIGWNSWSGRLPISKRKSPNA